MASEQEIANLVANWRQRLANYEQADRALFMHVNDLEPGILVIEQLQQQLAQAREENELLKAEVSAAAAISDALTLDIDTDTYSVPRKKLIDATHHWLVSHQSEKEWMAQARALLEKILKAKERLWNGAEEWNEVAAFLAREEA